MSTIFDEFTLARFRPYIGKRVSLVSNSVPSAPGTLHVVTIDNKMWIKLIIASTKKLKSVGLSTKGSGKEIAMYYEPDLIESIIDE